MNIGLTGGIGCGKSTVLKLFDDLGISVMSADSIVQELYRSDRVLLDQLSAYFGSRILMEDGALDRKELAHIVFNDRQKLLWLESLMHPKVSDYWKKELKNHPNRNYVVEIPLLFEKKLEKNFNFTVCVTVSREIQLDRLEKRGLSREESEKRMRNQMDLVEKERQADFVIYNNSSIEITRLQIQSLARILKLFGS